MKTKLLLICIVMVVTSNFASAESFLDSRWLTVDVGLGWSPIIVYPKNTQEQVDLIGSQSNGTHVQVNMNLDVAIPIGKHGLFGILPESEVYAVLSTGGYFTRVDSGLGEFQINNHIYDIGVQFLQSGFTGKVCFGVEQVESVLRKSGKTTVDSPGFGPNLLLKAGYDFNTNRGLGLFLGLILDTALVQFQTYSQIGIGTSITYF